MYVLNYTLITCIIPDYLQTVHTESFQSLQSFQSQQSYHVHFASGKAGEMQSYYFQIPYQHEQS